MTMKKKVLLICASALLLTGCGAREQSLLQEGRLRAAVTSELNDSEEIAERIAQGLGAPAEIYRTDRYTAMEMLSKGSADLAIGEFSETNDPGLSFLMTLPVAQNGIYVVCGGELSVTCLADLAGKTVGASEKLPESILRSLTGTAADEKLVCDNTETAAGLFGSGDMDAFVCFESEALELLAGNDGLRCCVPSDISAERYSILVSKGKPELFGAVNGIVGEMITGDK